LVLEDFGSGERRKIIDLTIAPYILLIFHLFFVFVMLIVFLLAYCNVVKCRHVKAMIAVSALFFIIVFVCFWVGLGFMVTANKTRREAYCYLFKLQNNLLYGNPNDGAEAFIGVHNMVALVTEFESEVPEIQRTSQNYISLQNANFK
jgi:ammonia channel protein AmtB